MERAAQHVDAVVVGAGFAGIYMAIKLRDLGFSCVVLETADGVGGTWYWNRYPGARCDVPSMNYSYSFSPELEQEWHWTERYATQPEIESYANHVVDKFGIRELIRFGHRVTDSTYRTETGTWAVATDANGRWECEFLIFATGGYSAPYKPDIVGIDDFSGSLYYTAQWPAGGVDVSGKRVGIIGTGASGMQTATGITEQGCDQLYIFQRTANYIVPSQNRPMDAAYEEGIKKDYRAYREKARQSGSGTIYDAAIESVGGLDQENFERHMAAAVAAGGPSVCGSVSDLVANRQSNNRVADYLRDYIRRQVRDPGTAELLCPHGYTLGSRRVLIETGFFDAVNQPNVSVVDISRSGIDRIDAHDVIVDRSRYPVDILVLATGFDSVTGSLLRIHVTGRNGDTLRDAWADGPVTYLGLMAHGFPNMFTITGPGSPSIRSNVMYSIEQHVEWIGGVMSLLRERGGASIEPTAEAQREWSDYVAAGVAGSLIANDPTQYFGSNVPGKPHVYLTYIGGTRSYRLILEDVAAKDYEGFVTTPDVTGGGQTWAGPPRGVTATGRFGSSVI